MAKIGYARVSTKEQSLDSQVDALKAAGCDEIFLEKDTGRKEDRKELTRCLSYLRKGDVLTVCKLDRLGRTTKQLVNLIADLKEKGIHFESLTDRIDTTTIHGEFFFTVMAAFSEMEAKLIQERTKAGLKAARARGRKGGRPRTDPKVIEKAIKLYKAKTHTIKEITEITGVSKAKLYQSLKGEK